jgi:flavodoxin
MRVEVLYYSRSGNTKKVADAIASVFGVKAKDVKSEFVLKDFDLLFLGSGVYARKLGDGLMNFVKMIDDVRGKKVAVFGTYAGNSRPIKELKPLLEEKGMKVVGSWGCRGRFLFFNRNRPNEKDLEGAREFATGLKTLKDRKERNKGKT